MKTLAKLVLALVALASVSACIVRTDGWRGGRPGGYPHTEDYHY